MSGFLDAPVIESAGGYQTEHSVRFRKSASARLSRAVTTTTNRRTFTYSRWLKLGELGSHQNLMMAFYPAANYHTNIVLIASGQLSIYDYDAGGAGSFNWQVSTSAKYRDPSGWMHVHLAVDTTQATPANRVKITVNGEPQTSLAVASYPALNLDCQFNVAGTTMYQNGYQGSSDFFDGGQADTYWIAGQAIDASYFGQFNADGVWVPKAYTGSYTDSNGFYLPFDDGSNLTNLCLDRSGNGNNWTATNVSLTAGSTYDWMVDTPTKNYCTLSPISKTGSTLVLSAANLKLADGLAVSRCNSTMQVSSGKWYFETVLTAAGTNTTVGIAQGNITDQYPGQDALSYAQTLEAGTKINSNTQPAYGVSLTTGDIFQVAFDLDNNKLFFGKNGTWMASSDPVAGTNPVYTLTAGTYGPIARPYTTGAVIDINFGQRPFTYTQPTGFKALNTANLPAVAIPNPRLHHDVVTVTKSGNTNFTIPWDATLYDTYFEIKRRDAAGDWYQVDGLRGYDKILKSNSTAAETTDANVLGVSGTTGTLKSTLPDGVYVVSMHKAGFASARQTNTSGSITSTVSANVAAGFSIVLYSGTGANATVGHGLGVAPKAATVKHRGGGGTSGVNDWVVTHVGLTAGTYFIRLNTTAVQQNSATVFQSFPSSSTIAVGTDSYVNASGGTYVAYCHAEVPGFSKFGSYTGNGSADGPFVYCGFRSRWVMVKCSSSASDWSIHDTARATYNADDTVLFPNLSVAEQVGTGVGIDVIATGFKLRNSAGNDNTSAQTYIFAAFAEYPFGGSNVAPAPAR